MAIGLVTEALAMRKIGLEGKTFARFYGLSSHVRPLLSLNATADET
jgi:hypothetical protein